MCSLKEREFAKFLKEKSDKIHKSTWDHVNDADVKCQCEWERAKAQEILMGEIIREFRRLFGDPNEN